MSRTYSYVGLIKKNSQVFKYLVVSDDGRYYVWTTTNPYPREDVFIPSTELELANQRQIDAGRGGLWAPNSSRVLTPMIFHGVVSGGKVNKTILVRHQGVNPHYFIYAVPSDTLAGLSVGDVVNVDIRKMSIARQDHIEAGLGNGTLRRKKRVSV